MEHPKILFYFAYNSPYSFLANSRIERVLARFTPEIEYRPVYSPRSAGAPAIAPERFKYMFEDVQRFADAYELKFAPGPVADTGKDFRGAGAAVVGLRVSEVGGIGNHIHESPAIVAVAGGAMLYIKCLAAGDGLGAAGNWLTSQGRSLVHIRQQAD